MATSRRTWQKREQGVAGLFGAKRQYGSGGGGREDQTRSDSTHPRLFVESKLRAKHATRTLHDATRALARKEGKTPILALCDKNRPGALIVVHTDDLDRLVIEFAACHAARLHPQIIDAIRLNHGIEPGDLMPPAPRDQD